MPPQVTTASIFSKIKGKAAQIHEKAVAAPIDYGSMGRLPAGIEGGVAVLSNIYLGEYKDGDLKGQPYLRAVGVVQLPRLHNGAQVAGMQTTLGPLPLCDTPNRKSKEGKPLTFNDNYEAAINAVKAMRTLPGHTPDPFSVDDLPGVLEEMKKARYTFRFRTWKGAKRVIDQGSDGKWRLYNEDDAGNRTEYKDKQGRVPVWATKEQAQKANPYAGRDSLVNEVWNGRCAAPGEEGHQDGVVDHDATHANGAVGEHTTAEEPTTVPTASGEQFNEFEDLGTLGTTADEKDEEGEYTEEAQAAQLKLQEMADQAGITEEDLKACDDWSAVAQLVLERQGGDGSASNEGAEGATPDAADTAPGIQVGDVVRYNPKDKKTGKPQLNPKAKPKDADKRLWLECHVDAVDGDKLKLTNLEDKKQKWTAKLEEVEVPS